MSNEIIPMREAGFYWVRRLNSKRDAAPPVVAEWEPYIDSPTDGLWYLCGSDNIWKDSDFDEIGPKIEIPPR